MEANIRHAKNNGAQLTKVSSQYCKERQKIGVEQVPYILVSQYEIESN